MEPLPLQVGVKMLLKNPEGRYLLLRRNPVKYPDMKPTWDIVGGRINPGADCLENLKREIKEEISLDFEGTPTLIAAQDIIRPDKHVVRLTYVGEMEGQPTIDADHLEAKWFSADEIKAMVGGELDSFLGELIGKGILQL